MSLLCRVSGLHRLIVATVRHLDDLHRGVVNGQDRLDGKYEAGYYMASEGEPSNTEMVVL